MYSLEPESTKLDSTDHEDNATSILVERWMLDQRTPTCSLDALFQLLEQRSFGGVTIVLALIGLLPGISIAAGIAIILIAVQILLAYPAPRLPRYLTQREIKRETLEKTLSLPLRSLAYVERFIKPRWGFMTNQWLRKLIAVVMIFLAIFMITPLPLSNVLPAIALLLIALGLLEKDGVLILTGFAASVIALLIGLTMISVLYGLVTHYFMR